MEVKRKELNLEKLLKGTYVPKPDSKDSVTRPVENIEYRTYESLDPSIPEGYKFDVPTKFKSIPTPTTKFSTLPEHLGGGEYAHDPQNRGLLVQSSREDSFVTRERLRAGKSSRLYQIDHVVPLWAGGTDNDKNKEVISKKDHIIKTKVGAIARTLWYDNKLSLPEAQVLALNWKGKNVDDIILEESSWKIAGDNPVAIAQDKIVEWQKPPKITLSDWWNELKSGPKLDIGKGALAQFGEGLISELALGYMPVEKETYETASEQFKGDAAQMAGQIAGVVGSFMMLGGIARGIAASLGIGMPAKLVKAVGTINKIPKVNVGQARITKALANAGLFTLHGQLSRQEQKGFDTRVKRFFSDAAFGTLLAVPGRGLRGSAGLWMGVFTLSAAFDPDDLNSALINATTVTALHGIGKINSRNRLGKVIVDNAIETREKFGLRTRNIKERPYTSEELNNELKSAKKKVADMSGSPEEFRGNQMNLLFSNREIYKIKVGFSKEAKIEADVVDMKSVAQRVASGNLQKTDNLPKEVVDSIADFNKPVSKKALKKPVAQKGQVKIKQPTGIMPVTGIGRDVPIAHQNFKNFVEGGAKKGDKVMLAIRDEARMTNHLKNQSIAYKNPGKSVQIIDAAEKRGIGYIPRKARSIEISESRLSAKVPEGVIKLPYDSSLNKNTIYDSMTRSGLRKMEATIYDIGPSKNGLPFLDIEITAKNWANSLSKKPAKAIPEVSKSIKAALNRSGKATDMIESDSFVSGNGRLFSESIKDLQNAIISGNSRLVSSAFRKIFKDGIPDSYAKALAKNPEKVTVGNLVELIRENALLDSVGMQKALTKTGRSLHDYLFSGETFYTTLGGADKAYLDSLKMIGNKDMVKSVVKKIIPKKAEVKAAAKKVKPEVKAQEPLPKLLSKKTKTGEIKQEIKLVKTGLGKEPGPLRVGKVDPRIIQEKIAKRPKTNTSANEALKAEKEIRGIIDNYDPKGYSNPNKISVELNEFINKTIQSNKNINRVDKNTLTERMELYVDNMVSSLEKTTMKSADDVGVKIDSLTREFKNRKAINKEIQEELVKELKTPGSFSKSQKYPTGSARFSKNGYEVSSAGDKRFSALNAKLKNGKTVEQAYQDAKGTGKGQPAKDPNFKYWKTYKGLWDQWARENPKLIEELRIKSGGKILTDKFATTENNQAKALYEIIVSKKIFIDEIVSKDVEKLLGSIKSANNRTAKINEFIKTLKERDSFYEKTFKKDFKLLQEDKRGAIFAKPEKLDYRETITIEEMFKSFIIKPGAKPSDTNKIWSGTYKELVKRYGKDVRLSKDDLSNMTDFKYTLSKEQVRIGKLINRGEFKDLPSKLKIRIGELIKKYPRTELKFYPDKKPTPVEWRYRTYNLFQDVTNVVKKGQFEKTLKELGIKIRPDEVVLVENYLRTGRKTELPTRLANIIEENYRIAKHVEKVPKGEKEIFKGEAGKQLYKAFGDAKGIERALKNIKTMKDLIGEERYSPITWALESLKTSGKNTDKQISMVIENLWPQLAALIKRAKTIKTPQITKKISEENKTILELLKKTKS